LSHNQTMAAQIS